MRVEGGAQANFLVRGARVIDGTGRDPVIDGYVLVKNGRIESVGANDKPSDRLDVQVIDAQGMTVMPGLIDFHTHLTYNTAVPDTWRLEMQQSVELNTVYATCNASRVLDMGFTTIGDGGCRGLIGPAIRDAVARGLIRGPRIFSTGPIMSGPGGLHDDVPPWADLRIANGLNAIVSSVQEARHEVIQQVKGGVDWIKVAASGVAGSPYSHADQDDLSYDIMREVVSTAARFGKAVHAHAHSIGGIRAAAEAGAISMHAVEFADLETLQEIKKKGIVISPTIAWLHARGLNPPLGSANDRIRHEAWTAYARARDMLKEARRLNVDVGIGTDACHRFPHVRDGVLEMEYFLEAGYSPLEILRAGTLISAKGIGKQNEIGSLEPGKRADMLFVDGDPSEDITVLRDKTKIKKIIIDGIEQSRGAPAAHPYPGFRVRDWAHLEEGQVPVSVDVPTAVAPFVRTGL